MFERYTEKARRVIFFARYEASVFGSAEITTEHLLLALIREEPREVKSLVPGLTPEWTRHEIEKRIPAQKPIPKSVDMPLSQPAKRVLAYAAEEAERLGHKHIGCEHLLLALAREKDTLAGQLLLEQGFEIGKARDELRRIALLKTSEQVRFRPLTVAEAEAWAVLLQWEERRCEPQDALRNLVNQRLSLYHGEPFNPSQFELVKRGWVYYSCAICFEDLYDPDNSGSSMGYTNGQDWLCTSCYERFAAPVSDDEGDHDDE